MGRRALVVAVVVALAAATLGSPSAGAAPGPTVTATGDVACSGTVKVKSNGSGLLAALPYRFTATVKGSLLCTGGTGNPSVQVRAAKVSGTFARNGYQGVAGLCRPLAGVPSEDWIFTVQWRANGGKLRATRIIMSNSNLFDGGFMYQGIRYPSRVAPLGTSTVTGSYAGSGSAIGELVLETAWLLPSIACANYKATDKQYANLSLRL